MKAIKSPMNLHNNSKKIVRKKSAVSRPIKMRLSNVSIVYPFYLKDPNGRAKSSNQRSISTDQWPEVDSSEA